MIHKTPHEHGRTRESVCPMNPNTKLGVMEQTAVVTFDLGGETSCLQFSCVVLEKLQHYAAAPSQ